MVSAGSQQVLQTQLYRYKSVQPDAALGSSHRFCGNAEGWGPLSPSRYDLTPCFLDVWVAAVAVYGILFGAGALWYLFRRCKPWPVHKNWHFYTKLTVVCSVIITTALQAALLIEYHPRTWVNDFRFWVQIVTIASLCVVFSVHYAEHKRSRTPNGVLLFFWVFFLVVSAVKLRSLVSQNLHKSHLSFFIIFTVGMALGTIQLILEWLVPKRQSLYESLDETNHCPYEHANVFSILSFSWMTPLMKLGYKHYLTQEDLFPLRQGDTTNETAFLFNKAWDLELKKKKPSLWICMFRAFGWPYFRGACFKSMSDVLAFVQPQLLRLLITFVSSYGTDTPQPAIRGAAIAIAMFLVSVLQTAFLHQYFQRAFESGMRVKSSLTSAIYSKAMRLSNEGRAAKSSGDIVNLMSVDTVRLSDLAQYGQMLWSAPLQIILCMASLFDLVGVSMLAGVGVMIIMIPINGLIAKIMKNLQKKQMKIKDARTRLMTEILNNMKSIKLFAWTTAFMNRLNFIRNDQELMTLRKIGASQAFANFTWSTTPFLVSCLTFAVFVFTVNEPLTTDIVFPALTLFNLLTFPLSVLPMVITSIIEASVAVGRLTEYFVSEEVQPDAVISRPSVEKPGEESVRIRGATFTWNKYEGRLALEDIDFIARKGELSCVVGRVGSGKSSLLQSMLGDLFKVKGDVVFRGAAAYVAQSPWVMNATVKENILFGHRWDEQFYDRTVKACALSEDFASLPDGDETEVGERGISLSGGQKARVTLARAVYARADVYLLDDVLSAVDQNTGRHLIDNVLGSNGLLSGKTKILATNSIPVLLEADFISLIRDGRIVEQGSYNQLTSMEQGEVAALIASAKNEEGLSEESTTDEKDDIEKPLDSTTASASPDALSDVEDDEHDGTSQLEPIKLHAGASRKDSGLTLRKASTVSFHGPRGKMSDDEEAVHKTRQTKESSEQGKVKWNVYGEYAKTSNLYAVAAYLVTLIAAQTAQVGGSIWLKEWSESNSKAEQNVDVGKFIGIYFAFGVGSALLVVVQTLILWIFCSIEAARKLHERMAIAMFRSPMSFFETTPTGRILNRFSADIYRIDETLPRTFNMLFVNSARAAFTLIIVSVTTPVFIALIIPLAALYLYIQRYYLRTSRELKRLDSVSRSPVYAHFQESLNGISTIRAYRQQKRFGMDNDWRVDANLQAYYPSISANRWLAVRLEFLGSVIILAAAGFAIVSVCSGSGLSAGLVGLSMSYALQITQSLNWIVRQTVEVETNIVSVERVLEYSRLPSEAAEIVPNNRPPISWPSQGAVQIQGLSTKYRPELDLILRDICLDIKPREKIGVAGRTGAGKSSLTLALFRIIEPVEGYVNIDGLDTGTVGLRDLRQRLAIIPQDAALFEGTIRENLDPAGVHDDTELWSVLEHARLKDHVSSMTGKLDARMHEAGSNLSQGQRQLVSIARALLTPSSILVLDEATAAVDVETDAFLQNRMKTIFKDRTIITIAHRINTIMDSDRIVVLEKGRVAEFDTPTNLMHEKGLFYKLVKEAGLESSITHA